MPLTSRARQEIQRIQELYGDVDQREIQSGETLIEIASYPLPSHWGVAKGRVAIRVPVLYPAQVLDTFLLEPSLHTQGSAAPRGLMTTVDEGDRQWNQISWHWNGPWDPNAENLVTFVRSLGRYFRDSP